MPTGAELVTPERVLFSGEAEFVVLRTDGGEIMFMPEHAPYIGAVDISLVRIAQPGAATESEPGSSSPAPSEGEFRAAVHGGFVHVAENKVTILASVAERADEIDVDRARRALEQAQAALSSGEAVATEREQPPAPAGEGGQEEAVEQSPAMKALLSPDDPEVALRRAEVRLEAAGAGDSLTSASH